MYVFRNPGRVKRQSESCTSVWRWTCENYLETRTTASFIPVHARQSDVITNQLLRAVTTCNLQSPSLIFGFRTHPFRSFYVQYIYLFIYLFNESLSLFHTLAYVRVSEWQDDQIIYLWRISENLTKKTSHNISTFQWRWCLNSNYCPRLCGLNLWHP
jgi:hypothetical protein